MHHSIILLIPRDAAPVDNQKVPYLLASTDAGAFLGRKFKSSQLAAWENLVTYAKQVSYKQFLNKSRKRQYIK